MMSADAFHDPTKADPSQLVLVLFPETPEPGVETTRTTRTTPTMSGPDFYIRSVITVSTTTAPGLARGVLSTRPKGAPVAELRGATTSENLRKLVAYLRFMREQDYLVGDRWNAARSIPLVASYLARENVATVSVNELSEAARVEVSKHDDVPDADAAHALLVAELTAARENVLDALNPMPATHDEAAELVDSIPVLDARFAAYLDGIGVPKVAERVRERASGRGANPETRLDLWLDGADTSTFAERREVLYVDADVNADVNADDSDDDNDGGEPSAEVVRSERLLARDASDPANGERVEIVVRMPQRSGDRPRWLANLAAGLWWGRVRPKLEPLIRRAHAALVHPVMVEVTELHSRAWKPEERNGQRTLQLPTAGIVVVPTLGDETLDALLEQGLAWLSSVTGHRLLRWEVVEGHRKYLTTGDRVLRVEGGWSGLAEAIGASTKKDADKLSAIVRAQAHCRFPLPDGTTGNLLSYREPTERAARGRSRTIEITLGTPLLPGYVDALPGSKSLSAREARRLVPMLADLPPFVGQRNGHGAQASLALAVVTELRTQAAELYNEGGVVVPFDRLGRRFGVKPSLLPEMRDRWTRDGDDGPAFLKSVDKAGRVTLGDEHKPARDFLEDAGRREIDGQHAGQKSADRRRAAQRRLGKPK